MFKKKKKKRRETLMMRAECQLESKTSIEVVSKNMKKKREIAETMRIMKSKNVKNRRMRVKLMCINLLTTDTQWPKRCSETLLPRS